MTTHPVTFLIELLLW